jgi:hypothetical protein
MNSEQIFKPMDENTGTNTQEVKVGGKLKMPKMKIKLPSFKGLPSGSGMRWVKLALGAVIPAVVGVTAVAVYQLGTRFDQLSASMEKVKADARTHHAAPATALAEPPKDGAEVAMLAEKLRMAEMRIQRLEGLLQQAAAPRAEAGKMASNEGRKPAARATSSKAAKGAKSSGKSKPAKAGKGKRTAMANARHH